ncbi:MAG TPA: ATP-binding cassette domain-containing protein [Hanamia sp.]|nr:ATP-binding cassette domain-containing protein [Hanamia sp.]
MQKPSIIVKDLSVAIQNVRVLDGLSFSLQPGQNLALLGDSGSGKTTLANALAGKIHFSGEILIEEKSSLKGPHSTLVEQRYSFKNLSGISDFYYQQRFNSFDSEDAPTVLQELLKSFSTYEPEQEKIFKIEAGLKQLGILYLKDAPLIQLSSGEHKRFQLIKALLSPPALLILDAPYTGLDVASRGGLNKILKYITDAGTQLILIAGTFPIPDCITHIALLENKGLKYFGEKESFDFSEIKFPHEPELISNPNLLPDTEEHAVFETVIQMKDVHIRYGSKSIIEKLNWTVNQGEKWLLKGRNGAGKSSLLNLVTGDHPQAYSNEIYLFGKRRGTGESIWDIKQKTGYVSPELHAFFDKNISVYQAIGSGFFDTIGLYKKLTSAQSNILLQWLDFLHLSHVQNKPLHSISTSLQRLTLLARALVKNPPLLILDEPCQGLDLHQRDQFISLIDHICGETDKTIVYVSHDEDEIPSCIEKVLLLEQGKQTIYSRNHKAALAEIL